MRPNVVTGFQQHREAFRYQRAGDFLVTNAAGEFTITITEGYTLYATLNPARFANPLRISRPNVQAVQALPLPMTNQFLDITPTRAR